MFTRNKLRKLFIFNVSQIGKQCFCNPFHLPLLYVTWSKERKKILWTTVSMTPRIYSETVQNVENNLQFLPALKPIVDSIFSRVLIVSAIHLSLWHTDGRQWHKIKDRGSRTEVLERYKFIRVSKIACVARKLNLSSISFISKRFKKNVSCKRSRKLKFEKLMFKRVVIGNILILIHATRTSAQRRCTGRPTSWPLF